MTEASGNSEAHSTQKVRYRSVIVFLNIFAELFHFFHILWQSKLKLPVNQVLDNLACKPVQLSGFLPHLPLAHPPEILSD